MRFTIAFGVSATKITGTTFFVGPPFLMANDHDLELLDLGEPGSNGLVVTKITITM